MIVNCRLEVTDEQRAALARMLTPNRPARLGSRKEFNEFVEGCIAAIPELGTIVPKTSIPDAPVRASRGNSLNEMVARARSEDREALAGKSDGFVIGWCKVKYAEELRA